MPIAERMLVYCADRRAHADVTRDHAAYETWEDLERLFDRTADQPENRERLARMRVALRVAADLTDGITPPRVLAGLFTPSDWSETPAGAMDVYADLIDLYDRLDHLGATGADMRRVGDALREASDMLRRLLEPSPGGTATLNIVMRIRLTSIGEERE